MSTVFAWQFAIIEGVGRTNNGFVLVFFRRVGHFVGGVISMGRHIIMDIRRLLFTANLSLVNITN